MNAYNLGNPKFLPRLEKERLPKSCNSLEKPFVHAEGITAF